MKQEKQHKILGGEWEDFELEFIDSYFPVWKQNIIRVVTDLSVYRVKMRISQAELAKRIGTTQSAITRFEKLGRMPSLEYIYRVAKGLQVNITPLSLESDAGTQKMKIQPEDTNDPQWKKDLAQIVYALKKYREKNNITQAELAEKIGTSQSVIARFEQMGRIPTLEFIYRVTESLGLKLIALSVNKPENIDCENESIIKESKETDTKRASIVYSMYIDMRKPVSLKAFRKTKNTAKWYSSHLNLKKRQQ